MCFCDEKYSLIIGLRANAIVRISYYKTIAAIIILIMLMIRCGCDALIRDGGCYRQNPSGG